MTFTLHLLRRNLSPAQLLFRKYKLNKKQKLEMILRGTALSQLAVPIGSAIYFILSQTAWDYPKKQFTFFYLGDTWDRLPVHIQDLLGTHWFPSGVTPPPWWVVARHDARHVIIGFIAALLVSSVMVGLKNWDRAPRWYMIASVPLAFLAAAAVAGPLIWLDTLTRGKAQFGLATADPYLSNLAGKGTIQLTIIGFLSGWVAKLILARTMSTIQLVSLENKMTDGDTPRWWWKIVYSAAYRNRYDYLIAEGHTPQPHGKTLNTIMVLASPAGLFLLGFGIWNLYFMFAAAAGH